MTTAAKKTVKTEDFSAAKIADGAREYVTRTAASAKERTESAYEGVSKFNSGLEKTMGRLVTGYVGILSEIADASRANALHTLSMVEKLAQAKTVTEAGQIQVDFVREYATANYDRVRNAVSQTRDVVTEGAEAIRESVAEVMPMTKKAA